MVHSTSPTGNGEAQLLTMASSSHPNSHETNPMDLLNVPVQKLTYSIHSSSGWTSQYHPQNILVNNPNDQGSRWSSSSTSQSHYLILKLSQISVLRLITFGKFYKSHVCNLKEFKVYAGLTEDNMKEILHSGLHNDHEAETFPVKFHQDSVTWPVVFIKIVPISAWGGNFNYSIWYIELAGLCEKKLLDKICMNYYNYKENEAVRLCLKHLRQRNISDSFESLQKRTKVCLEDPILERLFSLVVDKGSFRDGESLLGEALKTGLFREFVCNSSYEVEWKRILFSDDDLKPSMRGGHQMCIDTDEKIIYLIGGWDGTKDLADFWSFDIKDGRWKCVSEDLRREGGPGPRSCHKICFDQRRRQIYVLGRYIDPDIRPTSNLDCDFYRYDVASNRWELVSKDTKAENGPQLMYDHQLCIDTEKETLYVFGGRTITATSQEMSYSGLYSYHIPTNQWKLIRSDVNQKEGVVQLKSRIGHSMLFNSKTRQLYIFAGQRNKDYLGDFYVYNIDSNQIVDMTHDSSKNGGPEPGFTQRATLDEAYNELFVLSGLMREKSTGSETFKNSFWLHRLSDGTWHKLYHNENTDPAYWTRMKDLEPCPRYAHQLVYDPSDRIHYLFGGNPGESGNARQRLDDFWKLSLKRVNEEQVYRTCCGLLRKQIFLETLMKDHDLPGMKGLKRAVKYLQSQVTEFVGSDGDQVKHLACLIFKPIEEIVEESKSSSSSQIIQQSISRLHDSSSPRSLASIVYESRMTLYEKLCLYFPRSMRQPDSNLSDLVN